MGDLPFVITEPVPLHNFITKQVVDEVVMVRLL